jgi:hypothetical protein
MRYGFLQPRQNVRDCPNDLLCQKSVHFVAQPNIDAAIPQPADLDVDFAIVDGLKLGGEVPALILSFATLPLHFVLRFSLGGGLPLHVRRRIRPATRQRHHVILHISWA